MSKLTDREIVTAFLQTLEFDAEDTQHVLTECAKDPEARAYWLWRAREIILPPPANRSIIEVEV